MLHSSRVDPHRSIGVDDDLPAEARPRGVFRRRLAATLWQAHEFDASGSEPCDDLVGAIRRCVRNDEYLPALGRILDGENPFECAGDPFDFVVDGQHDADRGPLGCALRPVRQCPPNHPQELEDRGIAQECVGTESRGGDQQHQREGGSEGHRTLTEQFPCRPCRIDGAFPAVALTQQAGVAGGRQKAQRSWAGER